jgi:hypothetical protein
MLEFAPHLFLERADITGIVAIVMVFGPVFYAVKRSFDLREVRAEQKLLDSKHLLEPMREENRLLRERIEQLETIVCGADAELNAQVQRYLAAGNDKKVSSR